ncbi:MAG: porin family protein [Paludibacter sp.]|nr:porin family protein [Paludibacter sp.]
MLKANFKKHLLLSFFIFKLSSSLLAQGGNLPYVDDKLLHFGFSLGLNALDFGITPSLQSIDGKVYQMDVSNLKPGFSVGIISDLRLNRYLNLRFTPTLHFGERELIYMTQGVTQRDTINITTIPVCLPLYLKYSAERKGNYRPYLLWGGGIYYDLGRDTGKILLLKPFDFYTEFGVGCDLYFSFFKLSPELKFALGFNDIFTPLDQREAGFLSDQDKTFSLALSKLTSRMFTLTFNFE